MNITILYRKYLSRRLRQALVGDFDIEADYQAYKAYVEGDGKKLAALTKKRSVTSKAKLNKKQISKAKARLAKATAKHYA